MRVKLAHLRKRRPLRARPHVARSDAQGPATPRVVVSEWLDPLLTAVHLAPEMIESADGLDVGAGPGAHSRRQEWSELAALMPVSVRVAHCGCSEGCARQELVAVAGPHAKRFLSDLPADRLVVIDGNRYANRPGPRLVEAFDHLALTAPESIPT